MILWKIVRLFLQVILGDPIRKWISTRIDMVAQMHSHSCLFYHTDVSKYFSCIMWLVTCDCCRSLILCDTFHSSFDHPIIICRSLFIRPIKCVQPKQLHKSTFQHYHWLHSHLANVQIYKCIVTVWSDFSSKFQIKTLNSKCLSTFRWFVRDRKCTVTETAIHSLAPHHFKIKSLKNYWCLESSSFRRLLIPLQPFWCLMPSK